MKSVSALKASCHWTVLIDESGSVFHTEEGPHSADQQGQVVAIVVESSNLALVPTAGQNGAEVHMLRLDDDVQHKVFKRAELLPNVGVFGIKASGASVRKLDDGWKQAVFVAIDWITRLVPIARDCLHPGFTIYVERRGPYEAGDRWEAAVTARFETSELKGFHERNVSIQVVGKNHPHLSWADVIAYTWLRKPSWLKSSSVHGSWFDDRLFNDDSPWKLLPLLKSLEQGRPWSATEIQMAFEPEREWPAVLWNQLIKTAQERYPESLDALETLVNAAYAEGDSGSTNVKRLGNILGWINATAEELIPRLRGATRLQYEITWTQYDNHSGDILVDKADSLLVHAKEWGGDEPDLAAQATFIATMIYLNGMRFQHAQQAIEAFSESRLPQLKTRKRAIYWSVVGQLHGLQGGLAEATGHFRRALDLFSTMKDEDLARRDRAQTGAYLLYALMQNDAVSNEELRSAMTQLASLPEKPHQIEEWVRDICTDTASGNAWRQFLFWRWLAYRPTDTRAEQQAAISCSASWTAGEGHPWPWVHFYRWLVLKRNQLGAEKHATASLSSISLLACNEAPIFQLMQHALQYIIEGQTPSIESHAPTHTKKIIKVYPHVKPHLPQLHAFSANQLNNRRVLDLLECLLPFYFH